MARRAGCDRTVRHPTRASAGPHRRRGPARADPAASGFSVIRGRRRLRRCRERADAHRRFRGCARSCRRALRRHRHALAVRAGRAGRRRTGRRRPAPKKPSANPGRPVTSTLCASTRACSRFSAARTSTPAAARRCIQFIAVAATPIHAQPRHGASVLSAMTIAATSPGQSCANASSSQRGCAVRAMSSASSAPFSDSRSSASAAAALARARTSVYQRTCGFDRCIHRRVARQLQHFDLHQAEHEQGLQLRFARRQRPFRAGGWWPRYRAQPPAMRPRATCAVPAARGRARIV